MGFLDLAKYGLKGRIKISYILGLQIERTVEREKEKKRKRKRRRREEKKKKRSQDQKGMELLNLSMDLWFV